MKRRPCVSQLIANSIKQPILGLTGVRDRRSGRNHPRHQSALAETRTTRKNPRFIFVGRSNHRSRDPRKVHFFTANFWQKRTRVTCRRFNASTPVASDSMHSGSAEHQDARLIPSTECSVNRLRMQLAPPPLPGCRRNRWWLCKSEVPPSSRKHKDSRAMRPPDTHSRVPTDNQHMGECMDQQKSRRYHSNRHTTQCLGTLQVIAIDLCRSLESPLVGLPRPEGVPALRTRKTTFPADLDRRRHPGDAWQIGARRVRRYPGIGGITRVKDSKHTDLAKALHEHDPIEPLCGEVVALPG